MGLLGGLLTSAGVLTEPDFIALIAGTLAVAAGSGPGQSTRTVHGV